MTTGKSYFIKGVKAVVVGAVVLLCSGGRLPVAVAQTTAPVVVMEKALVDVKESLASLRAKLTERPQGIADEDDRQRARIESSRLFDFVNSVSDQIEAGSYTEALRLTNSIFKDVQTQAYQSILLNLRNAITELRDADRASVPERIRMLLKAVGQKLENAKTKEDVDALVVEVRSLTRRITNGRIDSDIRDRYESEFQQIQQLDFLLRRYGEMLAAEQAGDFDMAYQVATEISSNFARQPGLKDLTRTRLADYEVKRLQASQLELQKLGEMVGKATNSQDLNPVMTKLLTLMQRPWRGNSNPFQSEYQVLGMWMRVLDLENADKPRAALQLLNGGMRPGFESRNTRSVLVPPDLIDKKMAALQNVILERGDEITDPMLKRLADSLSNAKTLEELDKASNDVDLMIKSGALTSGPDIVETSQELLNAANQVRVVTEMKKAAASREWGKVLQLNQQFLTGRATFNNGASSPAISLSKPSRWADKINTWRLEVLHSAITQTLEFQSLGVTLAAGDPLDKSLTAAAEVASSKGEYRKTAMILQTYALLVYGVSSGQPLSDQLLPPGLGADIKGLELLIQGEVFEAAGDTAGALEKYKLVLEQVGPRVPTRVAIERIKTLRGANAK